MFFRDMSRAASFFLGAQKETKEAPGGRSKWAHAPIFAAPWTPFTGAVPLGWHGPSGVQNLGVLGYVFIRPHWGPEWAKFVSGAVFEMRLGVRTNAPGPFAASPWAVAPGLLCVPLTSFVPRRSGDFEGSGARRRRPGGWPLRSGPGRSREQR